MYITCQGQVVQNVSSMFVIKKKSVLSNFISYQLGVLSFLEAFIQTYNLIKWIVLWICWHTYMIYVCIKKKKMKIYLDFGFKQLYWMDNVTFSHNHVCKIQRYQKHVTMGKCYHILTSSFERCLISEICFVFSVLKIITFDLVYMH